MTYKPKTRTWQDNWNNVIRDVLFPDAKLKELMLVPDGTDIMRFQDKYFVRDASTDELLTNEKVRVVHYDTRGLDTYNMHVRGKYKEFDIFVKEDVEHTATTDRLQSRQVLIAQRIKELLLSKYNVCQLHFQYEDEYDLWTKTIGYKMYHIAFFYKTST